MPFPSYGVLGELTNWERLHRFLPVRQGMVGAALLEFQVRSLISVLYTEIILLSSSRPAGYQAPSARDRNKVSAVRR